MNHEVHSLVSVTRMDYLGKEYDDDMNMDVVGTWCDFGKLDDNDRTT